MTITKSYIKLPEELIIVLREIWTKGGKPYAVGGCIRDSIIASQENKDAVIKDYDIEVFHMPPDKLLNLLKGFGKVNVVKQAFPVYKLIVRENIYDFSIPRHDNSTGAGHNNYTVSVDPFMSIEKASERRDFTMNAIYYDPFGQWIHDPLNGLVDLRNKYLRPIGEHFGEDVLRILRAFQFMSRFNMSYGQELIVLGKNLKQDYKLLSQERIRDEWLKWAEHSIKPSIGLKFLKEIGWLEFYPEIEALVDVPQDKLWHPEGSSLLFESSLFSSITGSTKTVASSSTFGELFISSPAINTLLETGSTTTRTESIIRKRVLQLFSTFDAGNLDPFFSSPSSVTNSTKTQSFMLSVGSVTLRASKIFRVMFKIPFNEMHTVMLGSSHKSKVFRDVVKLVAINMMDMFPSFKPTTNHNFHNITMDTDAIPIGTVGSFHVFVPIFVVNGMLDTVDDDVIFAFDLCMFDTHGHNNSPEIVCGYVSLHNCITKHGDVFIHTCEVLDAMAWQCDRDAVNGYARIKRIFAALCHDFGKPTHTWLQPKDGHDEIHWKDISHWSASEVTVFQKNHWDEEWRWRSPAHDKAGEEPTRIFMDRLFRAQNQKKTDKIVEDVIAMVVTHMRHIGLTITDSSVKKLSKDVLLEDMEAIVNADSNGRPFFPEKWEANPVMREIIDKAKELSVKSQKPTPILKGKHLLEMGFEESPEIGKIIRNSFEAQLQGDFNDIEGAKKWVVDNV